MFTRLLVTGGAGFIGSNFVRHVLGTQLQTRIVTLDLLTYAGSLENLSNLPDAERHTFVRGDINDQGKVESLLREHQIDAIVHFAAESHVDRSILAPHNFIKTNILGTFSLLEAARKVWLEERKASPNEVRFHHISTDEVFGSLEPQAHAFQETTTYAPSSPYAASKAASDHLVRAHWHTYGLPISLTNCSNNYGPFQFPEKLIPLMILNGLEETKLPIYGNGMNIRDWLYVEDHCQAVWQVLQHGRIGESYNLGGNNQPTNLEVVELLCGILDKLAPSASGRKHATLMELVADRPGHDLRYAMDSSKIKKELNWSPLTSLQEGLQRTVRWYLDHHQWIDAIKKQKEYQMWLDKNYSDRKDGQL